MGCQRSGNQNCGYGNVSDRRMRAAVEKGFKQATGQWGTSLPSICNDTHDEINRRFDYWEKNGTIDGYVYSATQN